jgi:uncharacterized protein (DUF58 family)
MRANRLLVLLVMFGLVLAGLALQRGDLAALALPFLVYVAVAYAYAPNGASLEKAVPGHKKGIEDNPSGSLPVETEGIRLSLRRSLAREHVRPAQGVRTRLTVENQGPALDELALWGGLPAGVAVKEGPELMRLSLSSAESVSLDQLLHARRGEYHFSGVSVEASETLGLFSTRVEPPARARLSVEPAGELLRSFNLRPPQTRGFAGPVPARQGGRGTDFFIVREYQPGDPLRQINWKASSRAERAMYTNVYEQQRIADVGIILDAREQVDQHSHELGNLFEYSVRAAVTLTEPILKMGNRLGLLVYGPGMESVFPGYGKRQQRRILRALTRAGAGHNFALESLAHLPVRFFPSGSQIILISPLLAEDPPLVANLRTLGYGVLLLSPNPLVFESGAPKDPDDSGTPQQLAWRLANTERRFQLQRLQRCGVQVVDWDVREPLAPLLQLVLRREARRR